MVELKDIITIPTLTNMIWLLIIYFIGCMFAAIAHSPVLAKGELTREKFVLILASWYSWWLYYQLDQVRSEVRALGDPSRVHYISIPSLKEGIQIYKNMVDRLLGEELEIDGE